jgi:hypothetical protein
LAETVLDKAMGRTQRYHRFFSIWNVTNLTIGLASVIASVLAAAGAAPPATVTVPPGFKDWTFTLAILAGILTGVLTFLRPAEKANKYLSASDLLEGATLLRQADQTKMDDVALTEVINKANEMVR